MSTWEALVVLAAALGLTVAPGLLAVRALGSQQGIVRDSAIAPAVSLGLAWAIATLLNLLRLPVTCWTVLPLLVGVPVVGALIRRARGSARAAGRVGTSLSIDRWDAMGLLASVILGLALFWVGTSHLHSVVPNDDGTHHGFFVARILVTQSIDPSQVLVSDVVSNTQFSFFYPLAMHVLAAMVAGAGASVVVALNAVWISITAVALPVGMFCLARRTFPRTRRAAIAVAAIAAVTTQFPVGPTAWGGIASVVGMALVPGVADGSLGLLTDVRGTLMERIRNGAAMGLAITGIFFAHSTELITMVVLTGCLLVGVSLIRGNDRRHWPRTLPAAASAIAVFLLVASPWWAALVAGAGERAGVDVQKPLSPVLVVAVLLTQFVGDRLTVLITVVPLLIGIGVAVRLRVARGWLLFAAVVSVVGVGLGLGVPGSLAATSVWYSQLLRVAVNLVYPGVAFAGLGAWWLARAIRRRLEPRANQGASLPPRAATVAGVLLIAVPLEAVLLQGSVASAKRNFGADPGSGTGGSLSTPDARESWAWLAAHTGADDRVLNQFADGSGWMYAEYRVAPVFPVKIPPEPIRGVAGYLFEHAADMANDSQARAAASELHVRYAYVGDWLFPGHHAPDTPLLSVASLVEGGWHVVQHTATTTVLEIPSGNN